MINIKTILGSTRQGRTSEKILPWIQSIFAKNDELQNDVLDLREYALPFYNDPGVPSMVHDGAYPQEAVRALASKIKEADAFLIITPEYNHAPAAVLKNALDSICAEWGRKPVGFVSYGGVGGARAVEQLRPIATELQMMPIRSAVHIFAPWDLIDESGLIPEKALAPYTDSLINELNDLLWWARALKAAR